MKYRKKPVVIEATQWFKNGDHPLDRGGEELPEHGGAGSDVRQEGALVRYFRHPEIHGDHVCGVDGCYLEMRHHGWIDTLEGGHRVCPGDWIITGVQGEHYPCKPAIFEATYDPVVPGPPPSPKSPLHRPVG